MTSFTKDWGTPEGCESLGSSVSCTVPQSEWKHVGEQLVNGNAGNKWTGWYRLGGSTYRKRPRYGTSLGHGNPISQPVCWYGTFYKCSDNAWMSTWFFKKLSIWTQNISELVTNHCQICLRHATYWRGNGGRDHRSFCRHWNGVRTAVAISRRSQPTWPPDHVRGEYRYT